MTTLHPPSAYRLAVAEEVGIIMCEHEALDSDGLAAECAPRDEGMPSAMIAGLMLAANHYLRESSLPHLPVTTILQATGVGQARAYQCRGIIVEAMREAARPVGRPRAATGRGQDELSGKALDFLMRNPGAIGGTERHRTYSEGYRAFVLEQRRNHPDMNTRAFADALRLPLPTLRKWLNPRQGRGSGSAGEDALEQATVRVLVDTWKSWNGTFTDFCAHARGQLGLSCKRTRIAQVLEQSGARRPRRRSGRSPDERALRGSFVTFFPGAQWVADGKTASVTLNGTDYTFNFELVVDADSGALVGASLRDREDTQAVIEAFVDSMMSTGESPLSVLLDNGACNRSSELEQALPEDTLQVYAAKGRPQSKGHVEGAFGLFAQSAPPLHIDADCPRECARQILGLIIQTWARTLNYRPRKTRGNHSRVQLYGARAHETAQSRAHTRALIARDACRRERSRTDAATEHARAVARQAFARLGLPAPPRGLLAAISRYPVPAIVAGVAIYEGKQRAGTLPPNLRQPDADHTRAARYLLAIIRNIATEDEAAYIARAVWTGMCSARDEICSSLEPKRCALVQDSASPVELVVRLTDCAITSSQAIERYYWLDVAAAAIRQAACEHRGGLFHLASQYIHTSRQLSPSERLQTVRLLAGWAALVH